MQIISLRLPTETVTALKSRAWQESMRVGRNISFSSLIREAIDEVVLVDAAEESDQLQADAVVA